jgi:hypothetical protein
MKTSIKSTLIITAVLVIGIAIGFELSEISIRHRFDRMDEFRKPHGFMNMFEDIIKPTEVQKPLVDSILIKYHTQMDKIAEGGMHEVSLQMDSMKAALGRILDKEQSARLENEMTRMKRQPPPAPPGERGPMPPHGDRPPPPPPRD